MGLYKPYGSTIYPTAFFFDGRISLMKEVQNCSSPNISRLIRNCGRCRKKMPGSKRSLGTRPWSWSSRPNF